MEDDGSLRGVAQAYGELRKRLRDIPDETDRRIARDAIRDALDRDAVLEEAEFVAGSFAVEGMIREGPRFEVVRLRHRDLGTLHALKRPGSKTRGDPVLRRLLLDEAGHQAAVLHPACLPFRALLRLDDGRPGLLTDFIEAPTLSSVLRRRSLDLSEALALGIRVAEALRSVHGAGLVHGDPTPANLFVPNENPAAAILFDFGLSRPIGSQLGEDLDHAATPRFAAPEMLSGRPPADPAADLYGLGRILLDASGWGHAGPLGRLLAELVSHEPSRRPGLAETLERLQACGAAATDERKSADDPETDQSRCL